MGFVVVYRMGRGWIEYGHRDTRSEAETLEKRLKEEMNGNITTDILPLDQWQSSFECTYER